MARTARRHRLEAAIARLLTLGTATVAACAQVGEPPGGPPDFAPPVLLAVAPDSGAVIDGFDDDLEFEFDEVINEQSGGGLAQLFRVSPRHEEIAVSWRRRRLTVRPDGGWREGVVYTVTLLPGVTDLRNNRMEERRVIVFSTGGPIPDTEVTGTAIDWEGGRLAIGAVIELVRPSDSLTYTSLADSTGNFVLIAIPPGEYVLYAALDGNRNGRRDVREPFDSALVTLDSVVSQDLWTFAHDTIGPRLSEATILDSVAVAVEFNQALPPGALPTAEQFEIAALPDTVPVALQAVVSRAGYDSTVTAAQRAAAAAIADSILLDSLGGDSAAAAAVAAQRDSVLAADTLPTVEAEPDTTRATRILSQRPPLFTSVVLVLADPMTGGTRYLIRATVANLLGVTETSTRPVLMPAPPDSS